MEELRLETYRKWEVCIDFSLNVIEVIGMQEEADRLGISINVSTSGRIITMECDEMGTVTGLLEYMDLWSHIVNIKEIVDYTPSWKLNEELNINWSDE